VPFPPACASAASAAFTPWPLSRATYQTFAAFAGTPITAPSFGVEGAVKQVRREVRIARAERQQAGVAGVDVDVEDVPTGLAHGLPQQRGHALERRPLGVRAAGPSGGERRDVNATVLAQHVRPPVHVLLGGVVGVGRVPRDHATVDENGCRLYPSCERRHTRLRGALVVTRYVPAKGRSPRTEIDEHSASSDCIKH
jgi:hypothetical protein